MAKPIKAPESLKSALNRDANERAQQIKKKAKLKNRTLGQSHKDNQFANFLSVKEKAKKHPELMEKAFPGSVKKIKNMKMKYGTKMYQSSGGKISKYYKGGGNVITGR